MNYYKGLEKIGSQGDFENIPTSLIKSYIADFTLELYTRKKDFKKINLPNVSGWILFRDFMPDLNQKIEIYWSTDEITKQFWRNDIPWTGNEIPRFWRACQEVRDIAVREPESTGVSRW